MKTLRVLSTAIVAITLLLTACDEDQAPVRNSKTVAEFKAGSATIHENGSAATIKIAFTPNSYSNGSIVIKAKTSFNGRVETTPAFENDEILLPVSKGDSIVRFDITPIDNDDRDGSLKIRLEIKSVTESFIVGQQSFIDITVKDDENGNDPSPLSIAEFSETEAIVAETNTEGQVFKISLDKPASESGHINLTYAFNDGAIGDFEFIPAPVNGRLSLDIEKEATEVSFIVRPKNDQVINGDISIQLELADVSGPIQIGNRNSQEIIIKDDELKGLPKGYVTGATNESYEQWYTYDAQGRIKEIRWKRENFGTTQGVDTYVYEDDRIVSIVKSGAVMVNYSWTNGKVVRSEKVVNGILKEYTEYDYDQYGNVAGSVTYHLQADGSFKKGFILLYLYYIDGNLYKSIVYQESATSDELYTVATRTYEDYLSIENPFPMAEIIPGIKSQKHLPGRYTYEQNNDTLEYPLSYEFNDEHKPIRRTTVGSESTSYYYY